jgi:hypothetical protein
LKMKTGTSREALSYQGEKEFDTRDVYLVAALLTMEVEPMGNEPVRIFTRANDPGETYQFYFKPVSECGRYRTRELLKYWMEGESWVEKNEDHPFAHCIAFALNLKGVMKYVKGADPYVFLKKGSGLAVLPLNASAGLEEKILGNWGK